MGDRALTIITNTDRTEFSPVIYAHSMGYKMPEYLQELSEMMQNRRGDIAYSFARLVGIMHADIPAPLSLGAWSLNDNEIQAIKADPEKWASAYSHGDAGVIFYCADNCAWQAWGGYLKDNFTDRPKLAA